MWIRTYHRFASRGAFLAACEVAGWPLDGAAPQPPQGVALDELGPLLAPATLGPGGAPIPGEVLDARHHVNLAWHAQDMPAAFSASQVLPETPSRVWA